MDQEKLPEGTTVEEENYSESVSKIYTQSHINAGGWIACEFALRLERQLTEEDNVKVHR